ncbi:MAG: mechanosensitive ion channel family protein [Candidatus Omnitrophica bacterium]|nr:mechanosensitive ion channel family protein [Candidatus Omnitrophota bacterium]MDE2010414.1 mechanosensitive ion channel family protein [Candidatus Omnitrophota bacterium]MDE2215343.1 mechanosensitive ion channel family protein [Candidatus Omnitrophota bacterium]MDE2232360.1 mechanosensitive ion channel family protein [Candidatus Omnitrophota bacterium]
MHVLQDWDKLLNVTVCRNTVQSYLLALLTFLGVLLAASVLKRVLVSQLGAFAKKTASDFDDFIVDLIANIGWPVFIVVALHVSTSALVMPAATHAFIRYAMVVVLTIRAVLLLQKIIHYSVHSVLMRRIPSKTPSSQAMISSVTWVVRWSIWILGSIFILENLGVNISALMAGIGIGGIAVAMASQAILGDAFSALCIYLDKPFEIGDFIIIDAEMGTVEHIGVKTTRVRSLSGEELVFANSDLTKSRIKNYKRMQMRRVDFKIGVLYETPLDKVEKIPQIIKDVLALQKNIRVDRVHFQSFGDSALVYEIVYFVLSADYNIYMDIQQAINLGLMKEFAREGIEFAYPTQTLYVKKGAAS